MTKIKRFKFINTCLRVLSQKFYSIQHSVPMCTVQLLLMKVTSLCVHSIIFCCLLCVSAFIMQESGIKQFFLLCSSVADNKNFHTAAAESDQPYLYCILSQPGDKVINWNSQIVRFWISEVWYFHFRLANDAKNNATNISNNFIWKVFILRNSL